MIYKEHCRLAQRPIYRWSLALLCALALLCLSMPSVAFGKSLNGTFVGKGTGRDVSFNHHGKPLSDWAGTLKFKLDSGEQLLVFCIQIDVRVGTGDRYRSDGPVLVLPNGCKLRYLLDTYPASTAQDADEAAARQMAIWVFSDNVDPATIKDAKVRDRTIALVAEAAGKPCPKRRTEAPDLTIEPATARAVTGQVVTYSIQASPDDAGHPVTLSVGGPAVFADATGVNIGQQAQSVTLDRHSAATFRVLTTGVGQITVGAALPYQLEAGTVYSQIDDSHPTQRLVLAESRDLVAKASAQLLGAAEATPTAQQTGDNTTTSVPAEQATETVVKVETTETVVVAETAGATPVITAETTALPSPTTAQATAEVALAPQPARLPDTGRKTSPPWLALVLAGLLLSAGWWLRRRGGMSRIRK